MELTLIQKIAIYAIPVIFAITLHEAAHGYAALKFGDRTAFMLGRISFNPLRHIDPIGTILVPLLTYLAGGILFGWAKPVPVNFSNLRRPKKDMFWVAGAGPGANFLMALFWAGIIKMVHILPINDYSQPLVLMGSAGVTINAVLAALNLLPIPPLDGGRIAVSLLPSRWAYGLARVEPYGMYILIALIFTGLLGTLISPVYMAIENITFFIFGL
jgi:Zn-dependent protease